MGAVLTHRTRAGGGKATVQHWRLGGHEVTVTISARGHKSSEGDGRTAADIRRELEQGSRNGPE